MAKNTPNGSVSEWVDNLLTRGKNAFSLQQMRESFPDHSEAAMKRALSRLSSKNKIVSVHKGYYVIVSYEHVAKGIVPPLLYIDGLMKFLNRPYYVSLLSAAALYGAAHQAPQVFMVNTTFPALRVSKKKNVRIKFVPVKEIPTSLLEQKKTESGYVHISSPELTAIDLINYAKHVGGLSRAATVINELADDMRPEKIDKQLARHAETATLQRLGYIADQILHRNDLADAIENICKKMNLKFYRVSLMAKGKRYGYPCNERWKVIENSMIEID
ncbi:MAG TPA: type IV toxin-antitoxin system AbiEi family antitoxin [Cyclobacteriaceae bacterium]|nr:type IV toxin-antitoxin system AbiEi family antitoxin [Cyclobacteriaceae bacterium]